MVRLTQHAAEMIGDRRISVAWLEVTIAMPDWTDIIVITAYFDRDAKR